MLRILCAWDPDLSVLIGCALLVAAYSAAHLHDFDRAPWFGAGVVMMLLALISPIDVLADEYLFSAHMMQHLLLVLAVPPLLLMGITPRFARLIVGHRQLGAFERILGTGVIAWTIGVGILVLWHVPALFDAALNNEYIHIVEHLCFLVSATVLWWPVFGPLPECRFTPLWMQLYLLGAAMANSLLGIWLTFAPAGIYTLYPNGSDPLDLTEVLRSTWGLTPAVDQQMGGLLMWVGGGVVFGGLMAVKIVRWFGTADPDENEESPFPVSNR